MKIAISMLLIALFGALSFGQIAPGANAPGPVPSPATASAQATPVATPPSPAAPAGGTANILALEITPAGFSVLVSATDSAWISCTVSAKNPAIDLAAGQSWTPKGQTVVIGLKTLLTPAKPPDAYDVSCIPQFLTPPGTASTQSYVRQGLVPVQTYALTPEPAAVTVLATDADWKPSFTVSQPGTLKLVMDDTIPGLAATFDTNPGEAPFTRVLQAPIRTSVLEEGKYYRYHFEGESAAGNSVLQQQNKTYLLYKNTTPQLATPVSLTSQSDGIHVRFGLTRKVEQLLLQFPSGVSLKPKTAAGGGAASWTYDFVIPTDLQAAAAALDANTVKGINSSLTDATKGAATGTLKLNIINSDVKSAPTIAQFELSVVRVDALSLINALKSQNDKLGLKKSDAQNVANQALGITAGSSQQDRDAANALVGVLTQRGDNKFKNNLITFLITTGKVVAKAYGVPVP